jgi:hypothetical protein
LANPPLGGPTGWAASVAEAIEGLQQAEVIRTTRPNGTDRLVEAWDGTGWVTIHYDSGMRDIATLVAAQGWTGTVEIERCDRTVTVTFYNLKPVTPPGQVFLIPPAGFGLSPFPMERQWLAQQNAGSPLNLYSYSGAGGSLGTANPYTPASPELNYLAGQVSWNTEDPVPASLPGTAIGLAPAPPPDQP